MRRTDPLILGAGPAGTAAAIMLTRIGAKPVMLERSTETGDALCGGFLSWKTVQALEKLGICGDDLGGHKVHRLRVSAGGMTADAPLPMCAMGVSRRLMDTALQDRAVSCAVGLERGVHIREVMPDNKVRLNDGTSLFADAVFLATGKHDVRGLTRPRDGNATLGLRVRIPPHPSLAAALDGYIELHLFDGGYAGLILQEDGSANLCLATRKGRFEADRADPTGLLKSIGAENPLLGDRLAFLSGTEKIDAIAAIPYGWRATATRAGLFRLGDQAAVIPSLAGEGNGIALASGMAAADAWLHGGSHAALAFQREFAFKSAQPVGLAKALWHLAESPGIAWIATRAIGAMPSLAARLAEATRIR